MKSLVWPIRCIWKHHDLIPLKLRLVPLRFIAAGCSQTLNYHPENMFYQVQEIKELWHFRTSEIFSTYYKIYPKVYANIYPHWWTEQSRQEPKISNSVHSASSKGMKVLGRRQQEPDTLSEQVLLSQSVTHLIHSPAPGLGNPFHPDNRFWAVV